MKSVPGAAFKFVWNPDIGMQQTDATTVYPGDAYVDVIGVDAYDQSWLSGTYPIPGDADEQTATAIRERVWTEDLHGGRRGLAFWADFSRQHHTPLALGEWGVTIRSDGHGGGDNPGYIQHMYEFITDNPHVIFNCYFDVNAGDGAHQLSPGLNSRNNPVTLYFPESAEVFRTLFGCRAGG